MVQSQHSSTLFITTAVSSFHQTSSVKPAVRYLPSPVEQERRDVDHLDTSWV